MKIRKILFAFFICLTCVNPLSAALMISEFVTDTAEDWVEIVLRGEDDESMDVSGLYVTMYYGTNEPLASAPLTLHAGDRQDTPYDDRFLVIHLTGSSGQDETDGLGDINGNGIRDVYCGNYSSSLWNSDGVVAIDLDDDPSNGGIIDFIAYSNRDGSMNSSIGSYMEEAVKAGQWTCVPGSNPQECCTDIGLQGLTAFQALARLSTKDTNTLNDFTITRFQTPGRENAGEELARGSSPVSSLKKKIAGRSSLDMEIPLLVRERSNLRLRVFTVTGIMVHESPLFESVHPGYFTIRWCNDKKRRRSGAGMYIGIIESTDPVRRRASRERVYLVVTP